MLLLILLAIGAAVVLIDPNAYKARIAAAVKRETGRDLVIGGRITIVPSLTPTIQADDLTLSNAPTGSQPAMATVGHVEAEVAILPLFARRLVIDRLVLIRPRVLLETDAKGVPNWIFGPVPSAAADGTEPSAPAAEDTAPRPAAKLELDVRSIHVRDAEVTWRDGVTRHAVEVGLPRIDAATASETDPITAHVECAIGGVAAVAEITAGSLARLEDTAATSEFPLRVSARAAGGELSVSGTIARPLHGRGYMLAITGSAPDLTAIGDAMGRPLPPLRDVAVSARLADDAAGAPELSALSLQAGHSPLDSLVPGLALDALSLTASDASDPVKVDGKGSYGGTDLFASGTLASLNALIMPAPPGGAAPVNLALGFAGIAGTAKGAVAVPDKLSGVDIALDLRVADPLTLSRSTRVRLPAGIGLKARLTEAGASLRDGATLRDLSLTTPGGDITGEATLRYRPRPSVQIALASPRLDIDAMLAGSAASNPRQIGDTASPPVAAQGGPSSPPPLPAAAAAAPPPDAAGPLVVPDRPLPVGMLRAEDADIDVKLATVTLLGGTYRDVAGHLVLRDGHLTLDPLGADTPGGHVAGSLTADATNTGALPVSIGLHARGLALKPLLAGSGDPDAVSGTALIDLDLRGTGATPHDLAASADGRVGLSVSDGEIDNRLLTTIVADLLRSPKLAENLGMVASGAGARTTRLRCFAARLDVTRGTAAATTLLLESTRLTLQGGGTIAMGDEAVALRLRPTLRLGGTGGSGSGVAVPLRVGGTLSDLKVGVDAGGAVEALGARASATAERGGDPCPAALAAVAAPPPAAPAAGATPASGPATAVAPSSPAAQKAPNSAQILRGLLH